MARKITVGLLVDGCQKQKLEIPDKVVEVAIQVTNNEGKEMMLVRVDNDGSHTTILSDRVEDFPTNAPRVSMSVGVFNEELGRFEQRSDAQLYPIEKGKIAAQNITQGKKQGREYVIVGRPWVYKKK